MLHSYTNVADPHELVGYFGSNPVGYMARR